MNTSTLLILGQQQAEGLSMVGDVLKTLAVIGGIVFVVLLIGAVMSGVGRPPAPPPTFFPYEPNPIPQETLPAIIPPATQAIQTQPPWPAGHITVNIEKVVINYVANVPPVRPDNRWIEQTFSDQQPS